MPYLVVVSLLWAFSYGLIKNQLAGLDSYTVAATRLGLALLVFLPFCRPRRITPELALHYAVIGAVQFGLMYVLYIASFQHLQAHEVAMFTVFTPIYIVLLEGARVRRLNGRALIAAALALVGASVLKWNTDTSWEALQGFLMLQGSNLCFAVGQLAYRHTRARHPQESDSGLFAWLYLGAMVTAGGLALLLGEPGGFSPSPGQWGVLLYLGLLATGLGLFGWNLGATKVGTGTLAVSNNLLIPLAVLVSLLIFGESAPIERLVLSLVLMVAALVLADDAKEKSVSQD